MNKKPRKKLPDETEAYALCRRLEEYMEFAYATTRFSDYVFYEQLRNFIEENINEK